MRILGLDTTTANGSVAVVADGPVAGRAGPSPRAERSRLEGIVLGELRLRVEDAHSIHVLPAVDFLLGQLGLRLAELDGLAVAVGPGSFTGLRVGIGTVQGLSLGADRPIVGVTTLEALAERARGSAPAIVSLMDGYSSGVYAGYFDGDVRPTRAPRLGPLEPLLDDATPGTAWVGEPVTRARALIEARCPGAVFPRCSLFLAATIARLAAPRLAAGGGVPAEELRPVYLREPQIGPPSSR